MLDEVAERSLKGANLWTEVKDRLEKPGGGLSAVSSTAVHRPRESRAGPTCC